MSASTRRLLLAVLAWPAGIVAAIVWTFVSAEPSSCDPGAASCSVAMQAVPLNKALEWLALALAPGVGATIHWWRNRPKGS